MAQIASSPSITRENRTTPSRVSGDIIYDFKLNTQEAKTNPGM